MKFENGAIATILTTFDVYYDRQASLEIYGTKGTLRVLDPNCFGGGNGKSPCFRCFIILHFIPKKTRQKTRETPQILRSIFRRICYDIIGGNYCSSIMT